MILAASLASCIAVGSHDTLRHNVYSIPVRKCCHQKNKAMEKQKCWKSWNDVERTCEASAKSRIPRGDVSNFTFGKEVRGIRVCSAVVMSMKQSRARQLRTSFLKRTRSLSLSSAKQTISVTWAKPDAMFAETVEQSRYLGSSKSMTWRYGVSEVLGTNSLTIPVGVALKDYELVSGFCTSSG